MNIKTIIYGLVITSIIAVIIISTNPFVFAQSLSNQTDNKTMSIKTNSTANNSSRCSSSEETQLGAAVQSFLFRDNNGALIHMKEADKTLTGAAKMYLNKSISALQSGDTSGAKMHLQESQFACGIPDVT